MSGHFFTPPADQALSFVDCYQGGPPFDADPQALSLMQYFAAGNRASNVWVMADGSVSTTQPPNWNPGDPAAPFAVVFDAVGGDAEFTLPASQQVRTVFYGGHDSQPCSDADFAALSAAGYTSPNLV